MKLFTRKLLYFNFICIFSILFLSIFSLSLDANDEICNEDECFPKLFVATDEFQEVHEGQEIPPGMS